MFHLFAGAHHYPQAGLGDYVKSFETYEEAVETGDKKLEPSGWNDWYIILTEEDGQLVELEHKNR